MIPTPFLLNDSIIRVFVTFCDKDGIGRPGYVDVASQDPTKVLSVSRDPLFDIGLPGTFDENGVLTCSIVALPNGRLYLYYVGFELGTKIRYRLLTGLATGSYGARTFRRCGATPVLERSSAELYFRGGPYCLFERGIFRLWYVGGSSWTELDGKAMPVYDIRYAESSDGISWPSKGNVQIAISSMDEHGFGRPCVIPKPTGGYRMFYSIRRRSLGAYRLGYAESLDGLSWVRKDDTLNLDVSDSGFDSNAIMYAAPLQVGNKLYVFYNGNEFGRDGFAAALLQSE